jgi:hypothetical protein
VAGLFWGDEMRVGLIGQVRRVWAPRGAKIEQAVEHKYEWAYLNLAVNGLTSQLRWAWTENMKSESIAPVVKGWEEANVEVLVWDGARGHHGPAYEEVQIKRIKQPAYSPQLNPAERVFEYLRDKIEGRVYGTIAAKKAAVEAQLEKLVKTPDRIKSLAGWDWIRESVSGLSEFNMALHQAIGVILWLSCDTSSVSLASGGYGTIKMSSLAPKQGMAMISS